MNLELAESLALERHPIVQQAVLDVAVAETRRAQARHARFFPELELRNIWGPIPRARGEFTESGVLVSPDTSTSLSDIRWFTEVQLEAVQPLYTFGRLAGLADAARAGVEASRRGLEASRSEVRLQVRQLYWGVALGEALSELADEVLDRLAEADSILTVRDEEGLVTQNDLFKFDIFEYEVHKRHREARDGLEVASGTLRAALGLDPRAPIRTEEGALAPVEADIAGLDRYLEIASRRRPEFGQLVSGIAARNALARSRRAERLPQLFLGIQIAWNRAPSRFDPNNPFVNNPTNFFRPGVAVGFSWNANLFRTGDEVRLAEHEAARLESRREPLSARVRLEVQEAYLDVIRARDDLAGSERALRASENWFRAEQQTFDLGVSEMEDLVEAFQANVEMRTEHLRNIFVYNTALARLSHAAGLDVDGGGS